MLAMQTLTICRYSIKTQLHASFNFYEINKFAYLFIGFDVSFVFCCVEKETFVSEYKA